MEACLYRRVCRLIDQASPGGRRRGLQHSDAVIVKVYFFSTHSDRPVNWACRQENWPRQLLQEVTFTLPSQPTMSRRLRTIGVLQLIERVQGMLAEMLNQGVVKAMDSKPLKVGSYSKDRDAIRGRAAGEMARGYKLHAIISGKAFTHWTLTPMNTSDQVGAAMLLPRLSGWGYIGADNAYDANPVYRKAWSVNHQLIAPPRRNNATVRDTRRNCPQRIRSLDICANPMGYGRSRLSVGLEVLSRRGQIERDFGNVTMDGLYAPPPWVRTPHRMATWAVAKLIQRMARQTEIAGLMV
jgi:hypothetical protein